MERIDVAVVGAGAAGLAAADALRRENYEVLVLEARDRIGGRILTQRDSRVPLPIELGPEFIHGDAPETARILRESGGVAYEVIGDHWAAQGGRIRRAEIWGSINRVLRLIDPERPDESFARFLARHPGGRALARARSAAREFVQGFNGADVELISAHFVAPAEGETASESVGRTGRVAQGYDRVAHWLARDLEGKIRLRATVREISWRSGQAELLVDSDSGETSRLEARAAVITVPLGVLQAPPGELGAIRILPDPGRIRKAIDLLVMGSVIHLTIWFDEFPWSGAHGPAGASLERTSFLSTRGSPFRVWWTAHPMRCPLAVAWSGGPPAADLARHDRDSILDAALRGLAKALGRTRRRVESRVQGMWTHNWLNDPYSRGAYSYARVGGADAARILARPVEGTLFFAGEATDTGGNSGTVEGAIASGLRAARQVDTALGRR